MMSSWTIAFRLTVPCGMFADWENGGLYGLVQAGVGKTS